MTSKREKLQYAYVFFADLLTMAVSVLLAWLITDGLFGVLIPYTSTDWLQTLCLLFVAFVVTFFFFDQDKNIVTRSENEEISLSLRFNIAFGLVYAGCMLLAKATMLDSRYFAVTVPAVNAVLLPFSHAILKRLLIRFQRSWGMETLVGVVTTSDRAERLIRVTEECVELGLAAAKPWGHLGDIADAINTHAKANGYSVVEEIGGHGIGLAFHEDPFVSYVTPKGSEMLLVPGMMFTIEPMINEGSPDFFVDEDNDWTIYTMDDGLSAQIEYMVLITENGAEVLTK